MAGRGGRPVGRRGTRGAPGPRQVSQPVPAPVQAVPGVPGSGGEYFRRSRARPCREDLDDRRGPVSTNVFPSPGRGPAGTGAPAPPVAVVPRRKPPGRAPAMAGAAALAVLAAACGGGHSTPQGAAGPSSPAATSSPAAASPAPSGPATGIVSYPQRVGSYRLVNKADRPVTAATTDTKFPQSFSFAATARDGYYLPGRQRHQIVYLIAGRLAQ